MAATDILNPTDSRFDAAFGLLETLKERALRGNKRKNLDLLWETLNELHRERCPAYTLAEIGRRLQARGGPKTQSLRNDGGKMFRDLIEAFAASAGVSVNAAPSTSGKSQLDLAVEALSESGLRAMFRQVIAENKLLRGQNQQLRSSFKALSISTPPMPHAGSAPSPASSEGANTADSAASTGLTAFEQRLLKAGISTDRFAENGWTVADDGGVLDDANVLVLSPGFIATIKKLIEPPAPDLAAVRIPDAEVRAHVD